MLRTQQVPGDGGATAVPPPAEGARVVLRAREEARILRGHRWVFSNEIARVDGEPAPGSVVDVVRQDGRFLGRGFYNAHSLIAVRILSDKHETIDRAFVAARLRRALLLRRRLYPGAESFRLVHGESDDLPGLIIDKYEDCFSIQTLCLGVDLMKEAIVDALEEVFRPRCVVERNTSSLRQREGLDSRSGVLKGEAPERVLIAEGDLKFEIDLLGGQKTGFYFDQRENRACIRRYVPKARVLDAYCHDGAFALHAAKGGADAVLGLDVTPEAIARAQRNAQLNALDGICQFEALEAGAAMETLHGSTDRFDVVILDPPSFTRTRKNVVAAKKGYEEVNRKAIRLLRRGGILATASCSFHITDETFMGCIQEAAFRTNRVLRLLEWRSQAPDHPILPSMPETRYLKFGVFQVD
ncbi:MAG TPA: class I SAM-dependent rRNA methyltransferase [Candidatus Polarisedimenticolia bacterium]|nr:class I SAM-dependent rRNA methyltransferase [Candidatus Polarisedimenticolia bacterium]